MKKEIWKCIPGHPKYIASNLGNIMRLPELPVNDDSKVSGKTRGKPGLVLSPRPTLHGHLQVCLTDDNGVRKMEYVHRLVAMAFIKRRKGKEIICHIDDNPSNNNSTNLMWGTHYINSSMIKFRNLSKLRGDGDETKRLVKALYIANKKNYCGTVRKLLAEIATNLGISYSYTCQLAYSKN